MRIKSITMPNTMITIDSSYTLSEIACFFKNMGTEYLTIANNGQFVGILCRHKFNTFIESHDFSHDQMSRISALGLVEEKPHFCKPENRISEVFEKMKKLGLKYLVVWSFGKIIGILSFSTVEAAATSCMVDGVP